MVGLYVDPPERAVVFSFDEKTQCQAIDRTQPSLPMKPGRARTMTHDYRRHGTLDLFSATDVAIGEVLHQTRRRHTGRDAWAHNWNQNPKPLAWTKPVDDIIAKAQRAQPS